MLRFKCPKFTKARANECANCTYGSEFIIDHIFKGEHLQRVKASVDSRRDYDESGVGFLVLTCERSGDTFSFPEVRP